MINLQVDEAYAFDYLAILEVKSYKTSTENKYISYNIFLNCKNQLNQELLYKGWTKEQIERIYISQEYIDMVNRNNEVFDLVDKVKSGKCSGKDVDNGNFMRYKAKQAFQKKFFTTELKEVKIGYEDENFIS